MIKIAPSRFGRRLSYVEDPRGLARDEQLKPSERGWLRDVASLLAFSNAKMNTLFPAAILERAEQAFRLLCA